MEELGVNVVRMDPANPRGANEFATGAGNPPAPGGAFLDGSGPSQAFSDAVNIFLFSSNANLGIFIQALQNRGLFKSLAEPNLMAIDGEEASFLAGGEFPFPIVQGGGVTNAVTIEFKEFGIKLNFTPTVTNSGNIRLHVNPEVSALDFSNGLEFAGFLIPSLLIRRAETEIELLDGQTFAIAGLIDNSMIQNMSKVPILGDIPILGSLFRSKELRQRRTELLVLVTPHLVEPMEEAPPVPTGEPEKWKWMKSIDGPSDTVGMKKPDSNP
jgi:pilus assembly protein CpaC